MMRRLITACLVLLLAFAMPVTAFAQSYDPNRLGSVSVTLMDQKKVNAIVGAELSAYYVATAELNERNHLSYMYTEAFEGCGVALDDKNLSHVLEEFTEKQTPAAKTVTDAQGKAVFENLPLGLYFIKQTNSVNGYAPCTSFLVTVPMETDGEFQYAVNASPKTESMKLTNVYVKKQWNTDKSTQIADRVIVQLLRDSRVVGVATLNKANNWEYTFFNMPESDSYSIIEIDVPKGFVATYTKNGYEFTVINSAALIQTGQLVWPVPVLALAGLLLIAVGTVILRRSREANE